MSHPIPGFDYGCGAAYHTATPDRQSDARFAYWHDLKARLDYNTLGIRSRDFNNAAELYLECHAGIREVTAGAKGAA